MAGGGAHRMEGESSTKPLKRQLSLRSYNFEWVPYFNSFIVLHFIQLPVYFFILLPTSVHSKIVKVSAKRIKWNKQNRFAQTGGGGGSKHFFEIYYTNDSKLTPSLICELVME